MQKSSLKEKYLIFKVRQQKDAESYGKLYDYYVERIYRFILFKVATAEEAEDLTSEVFLKTWEYINNSPKKIDNFNALLYRVARNCVIDYYRTRKQRESLPEDDQLTAIMDERNASEKKVELKIEKENLEKMIQGLKDIYKEVVILRYIEEFSIKEIAAIIGKNSGNVRVLLHRAMEILKESAREK